MAAPSDDSLESNSNNLSLPTGEGIIIDIGTGDGRFVYHSARENPQKFFIGIDPNLAPLEKISEKIHRKPTKGGLSNVLFLQAAIEDLPAELDGVADEVHIHFPWGSLLRAVAAGDEQVLSGLRKICAAEALLEIVIGVDEERDQSEWHRLGLTELTAAFVEQVLRTKYLSAGFKITECGAGEPNWSTLHTTWAKRLSNNPNRQLFYIIAEAVTSESA